MNKIGLFWGSTSGNTEEAAEYIESYLAKKGVMVDSHDVGEIEMSKLLDYQNLIIGCPTWDIGELQGDWDDHFATFKTMDFSSRVGAFFGAGDQIGYANNFIDAVGILGRVFEANGGRIVGHCDPTEYNFTGSVALEKGMLMGLALDYDNYDDKCEEQLESWLDKLLHHFQGSK